MNLLALLTTLTLTLTTTTLAIEDPTPTTPTTTHLSSPSASPSADNDTCPSSRRSKQCCTSINGISDSIFGKIGKVIPILKDVKVSSTAAFNCKGMNDNDTHDQCLSDVMCCNGSANDLSESSHKTHCKPYDKAIKDKSKYGNSDEDSPLAAALDKASSANAYRDEFMASSTPLAGSSSSFAAATPTPEEG